jgi:hypothetical protein
MNPFVVLAGSLAVAALAIVAIGYLAHRGAVEAGAIDVQGDWPAIPDELIEKARDEARMRDLNFHNATLEPR